MKNFFSAHSKTFAIVIILSFIFHHCTLYHRSTVSIDQAVSADSKSFKIITQDDRTLYFNSLYYKDSKPYGVLEKSRKNQTTEIRLNPESIKEIHLQNKAASTAVTALIAVGIPAALIAYGIANFELDLSGMDFD